MDRTIYLLDVKLYTVFFSIFLKSSGSFCGAAVNIIGENNINRPE